MIKWLILLIVLAGCTVYDIEDNETNITESPQAVTKVFVNSDPPECIDIDKDGVCEDLDCDDNNPLINPSAEEVCDKVDNNCDEIVDEGCVVNNCPPVTFSEKMEKIDDYTGRFVRDKFTSIGYISFGNPMKFTEDSQLKLTFNSERAFPKDNIKIRTMISSVFLGFYDITAKFENNELPTQPITMSLGLEDFQMGSTLFNTIRVESTKQGPDVIFKVESCPDI